MKHKWLATLMVLAGLGLGLFAYSPHADAAAPGASDQCKDVCTVLVVQLTGTIPSGTIQVTAARQEPTGAYDNNVTLGDKNDFGPSAAYEDFTLKKKLANNEYTTLFGLYGTNNDASNGGPACADPTANTGNYIVTVNAGGKKVTNTVNVCHPGQSSDGAWVKKISITLTASSSKGGVTGKATYNDIAGSAGTGACKSNSILFLYGGPDKLSQNDGQNMPKISITSDGSFTSGYNYKPSTNGADYKASVTCFDSSPASRGGTFTATVPVEIKAGKLTNLDLTNLSPIGAGGGQSDPTKGDDSSDTPTCESSGFSLSWIMCPIINGLASAVDGIYGYFIQPLLQTTPIVTSANGDPTNIYKIWSNFRIYGDIFLVIALLVIVFGQSIGGGMIDAYTAKKVLPRLLIAAVLINLSIYIVALLVDITNIVGGGIQTLLTQPFKDAGDFTLKLSGAASGTLAFGSAASLAILIGGIWALIVHTGAALAVVGPLVQFVLLFILLPAFLTFIAILVTVLIRRGLILFLVIVSPVAFALYCLPNTEQYFRKWWDLLFKTLLVYPIIAVVFAIANIMSVTIGMAGQTGFLLEWVSQLMSVAALVIPLFLIPFAFRIAGGVIGKAHEVLGNYNKRGMEAFKGNVNDPTSLRNRTRQKVKDQSLLRREAAYDSLNKRGALGRFAARRIGGYNLKAATAGMNARVMKEMQDQNDTGDDTEQRALSVHRKMLDKGWREQHGREGIDYRQGDNGMEYRTLGGAWVGEGAVASAYARWGNNTSAMQWSLGHEMEKASTQEEQDYLATRFGFVAGNGSGDGASWRMTGGQRAGLWKGAAFNKQNINRQWKHYGVGEDGGLKMGGKEAVNLFREIDEKQGSYAMMQQNADTWTTMSEAMTESKSLVQTGLNSEGQQASAEEVDRAREILQRGSRIAFSTRSSAMASSPVEDGDATIAMRPGMAGREVGSGAAGRVQEEMIRFVNTSDSTAGVYQPPSSSKPAGTQPAARPNDNLDNRASDRPRNVGHDNATGTPAPAAPQGPRTTDGSGPRNDINI